MNDYRESRDDPTTDPIEFGEWLELTAESRDVSREEVLEQLISSYWTLNEMTEMLQEPDEAVEGEDPFTHRVNQSAVPVTKSEFEVLQESVEERFAEMGTRMAAVESEIEADDGVTAADLEQNIEKEFSTLRTILEHLITSTEANEEDLDAIADQVEQSISSLRDEYSSVAHLKHQAMSLGVSSADCDYCRRSVDLAMLPSPTCPNCGRTFTDIEPGREFLGISLENDILKTEPPSAQSRNDSGADSGLDDAGQTDEDFSSKIGGFVWGSDD